MVASIWPLRASLGPQRVGASRKRNGGTCVSNRSIGVTRLTFPATGLANAGGPTLTRPSRLPMRGPVDPMKVMMVERVSNADRARYTLRASPNARQPKDQTITISLQQGCPINDFPRSVEGAVPPFFRRRTRSVGGPNLSIAAAALDVIGPNGPFNLATTGKNNCRVGKNA